MKTMILVQVFAFVFITAPLCIWVVPPLAIWLTK